MTLVITQWRLWPTMACAGLLSACGGVNPENQHQALALKAIQAAEAGNMKMLDRLTRGAKVAQYGAPTTVRQVLTPEGCTIDRLWGPGQSREIVVQVEWSCNHIQGHLVNLTISDDHISEIWWSPGE